MSRDLYFNKLINNCESRYYQYPPTLTIEKESSAMIFIKNKYHAWYFNIIKKAQLRSIPEKNYEVHHIVPRSLGGSNNSDNLVHLTLREHLIVHLLLTKITSGEHQTKMLYSFNMMSNFKKYNGRKYQFYRRWFTETHKKRMSGKNHPNYGKKQDQDTIEKRIANTDKNKLKSDLGKKGSLHPTFGKSLSASHKEKISSSSTGHKKPAGFGKGIKNSNYGKKHPGLNSGEKNSMFGLFGENNPNFGGKRTPEQKNNIRISKVLKNLDKYFLVIQYLENNITSLRELSEQCGVSEYTVRQLKKGNHIACQLYKEQNAS